MRFGYVSIDWPAHVLWSGVAGDAGRLAGPLTRWLVALCANLMHKQFPENVSRRKAICPCLLHFILW